MLTLLYAVKFQIIKIVIFYEIENGSRDTHRCLILTLAHMKGFSNQGFNLLRPQSLVMLHTVLNFILWVAPSISSQHLSF